MSRCEVGRLVRARTETIAGRLGSTDAALVLCGHSHQQHMVRLPGGPLVLNPGSVGLSEVGTPHARYALVRRNDGAMTIDLSGCSAERKAAIAQYVPSEPLAIHEQVIAELRERALAERTKRLNVRRIA